MPGLLIIYHSRTGGSRQMAQAAFDAARPEGPSRILSATETTTQDMLSASGYLFCGPENLAALSGAMKEFFDQTYYPLLGQIEGRPYAQMICAGSDGANAARQLARVATGWRLREVQPPLIICTKAQTPHEILAEKIIPEADLDLCRALGQALSAGLEMGAI